MGIRLFGGYGISYHDTVLKDVLKNHESAYPTGCCYQNIHIPEVSEYQPLKSYLHLIFRVFFRY